MSAKEVAVTQKPPLIKARSLVCTEALCRISHNLSTAHHAKLRAMDNSPAQEVGKTRAEGAIDHYVKESKSAATHALTDWWTHVFFFYHGYSCFLGLMMERV